MLSRITLPFVSYSLPSKALPITVPDVCIVPVEVILLNVTLSVVASDCQKQLPENIHTDY